MNKYIIFDYDGTLHDSMYIYAHAFRRTYEWLVDCGQAPPRAFADSEISSWLGYNSQDMWEAFMPSLSHSYKERASQKVGQLMLAQMENKEARLYSGALTMLAQLKQQGYRLIFLSNCKETYMDKHRDLFDLGRYFDHFYCCETYNFIPKTEIFTIIAQEFPGQYLMVGDRFADIDVAITHHLPSIGCAYGFGEPKELEKANVIAEDVAQIPRLVEGLWR